MAIGIGKRGPSSKLQSAGIRGRWIPGFVNRQKMESNLARPTISDREYDIERTVQFSAAKTKETDGSAKVAMMEMYWHLIVQSERRRMTDFSVLHFAFSSKQSLHANTYFLQA